MARTRQWVGLEQNINTNDFTPEVQTHEIDTGLPDTTYGHTFVRGTWRNTWTETLDSPIARDLFWVVFVGSPSQFVTVIHPGLLCAGVSSASPPWYGRADPQDNFNSSTHHHFKDESSGQHTVSSIPGSDGLYLKIFRSGVSAQGVGASMLTIMVRTLKFTD